MKTANDFTFCLVWFGFVLFCFWEEVMSSCGTDATSEGFGLFYSFVCFLK